MCCLEKNYSIFDIDNFKVRLQYGVASLCSQLLLEFSSNQFETLHKCYQPTDDVRVILNYSIFDLDNFEVRLQYGVASLCSQLLLEFSSNQFETLHKCYQPIEDVHVIF